MATSRISASLLHNFSRRVPRWGWILTATALLIAVFIAVFDWNWFKGPIERRVQAATGRTFLIGGDLDVDLGLEPRITADDVRFGNASWSHHEDMVRLERVDFRVGLVPWFRGRIEMPYLRATKPVVVVERNRNGQANWVFEAGESSARPSPTPTDSKPMALLVKQLFIDDGTLRIHEPALQTDVALKVRTEPSSAGQARAPLIARGEGTYRGQPFDMDLRVEALDLADRERPYHVDAKVSAGATRARARGELVGQLQLQEFALRFDLSGDNLGDLYSLFGVAVPDTPPYELTGRLGRNGNVWSYENFKGRIGDSNLAGDASFEFGKPQRLKANVVSTRLDFDDLGALVGAPPSTKEGETASAAQREQAAQLKTQPRLLPDSPFNLDKLRIMDADVTLRAERVNAPKLPIEKLAVHLRLDGGVLKLDPLDFTAAGGTIATRLNLDARHDEIRTTLTGDVNGLELPKLFPSIEITKKGAGKLSGALAFETRGNSVAQMLANADGDVGLIMGPGQISNLLVEVAGLDVAESLKFLLDKDKQIPLRCAYADFHVDDGIMRTRALAFDTSDTVVHGEGKINLRNEAFDLKLSPQPKDRSPLSARVPLKIDGSFKDPSFHPDAGPLALRGAAAAALYAIAPPAALLALIETGPGKNIDCGPVEGEKVSQASKRLRQPTARPRSAGEPSGR